MGDLHVNGTDGIEFHPQEGRGLALVAGCERLPGDTGKKTRVAGDPELVARATSWPGA